MDVLSLEETDEPDLKKYISAWKVASGYTFSLVPSLFWWPSPGTNDILRERYGWCHSCNSYLQQVDDAC